jgi:hypothetical protein
LYFSDRNNVVRVVDLVTGIIKTAAGGGAAGAPGYGDGGPATAATLDVSGSTHLSIGPDGALYIGDGSHNAIRRVAGGVITTWEGPSSGCAAPNVGEISSCGGGCAVAWDSAGNAFYTAVVCDGAGGGIPAIVRRNAAGVRSLILGRPVPALPTDCRASRARSTAFRV